MAELDVCPVEELPPCSVKIVYAGDLALGVYNLNGEYYAIEDRCSHDDGPLAEGDFDCDDGVADASSRRAGQDVSGPCPRRLDQGGNCLRRRLRCRRQDVRGFARTSV